jgi:Mg-chelatase subunit ChlD
MKQNYTRIAVILDRSGSMHSVREATVAGFNEFVRDQKKTPGEVKLKLVQFDDQYEEVFDQNLHEVPELTQATFVPRGWTALLDAQGRTIVALGAELAAQAEDQRPSKVIVMTLTDGEENRSKEYNLSQIAAMIKEQREKYGWEFVFLGANQDAVKVAATMNIDPQAAVTYNANAKAMGNVMRATSANVSNFRATGQSVHYSNLERCAAMVEDEDDKNIPNPLTNK